MTPRSLCPWSTSLPKNSLLSSLIARKMLQDISGGSIGHEISSIVDKMTNILKKHSVVADAIDDAFSFQLIEYSPAAESVFKAVLEGCLKKLRLSFTYASPAAEEKSERTVEPYHLFNYMGMWHTIGYCHLRKEIRDFALSRTSEPKVLAESFKIPAELDFKKYFLSTFGLYRRKAEGSGLNIQQIHFQLLIHAVIPKKVGVFECGLGNRVKSYPWGRGGRNEVTRF